MVPCLGRLGDRGQLSWHSLPVPPLQVALDVVKEICTEMALTRPEAFDEYVIFLITNRGEWPGGLSMLHSCPPHGLWGLG